MVIRNKLYRIFDKYLETLNRMASKSLYRYRGQKLVGNRSKKAIIKFYLKNNRWPNRKGLTKQERSLGTRFENFVSKESATYDSKLRRIALVLGRKPSLKRKHNVAGFKKEILAFVKEHGRAPQLSNFVEGEFGLRCKLDYYTQECNDMTFLGKVYEADKCHRSGIPSKYRAIINERLDTDLPLIRMV